MKKFHFFFTLLSFFLVLNAAAQTFNLQVSSPEHTGGYNITCNGAADARLQIVFADGAGPFDLYGRMDENDPYEIFEEGIDTTVVSGDSMDVGTYYFMAIDANDDTAYASITITEPDLLQLALTSPANAFGYNLDCYNDADGLIDLSVQGGVASYSYSWQNGSTTEDLVNIFAGYYEVSVTDANGCVANGSISLTAPDALTFSFDFTEYPNGYNFSCTTCNDGEVTATTSGGAGTYSYSWSTGGTDSQLQGLYPDSLYALTVTDESGCSYTDNFTLQPIPDQPFSVTVTVATLSNGYND